MTNLETINREADTSILLSGNLSDAAFFPANSNNPETLVAAKDKITGIDIQQQVSTQAIATPELSNRLSPMDDYAFNIMALSGQLPESSTPPIVPDMPKKTDLLPDADRSDIEPRTNTMSIIAIVIVVVLLALLLKGKIQ